MNTLYSIPNLINEVKRAVNANAQFSALCLTLALAENCSQVEWLKTHDSVNGHDKDAYVSWFDKYYEHQIDRTKNYGDLPILDGSFLYQIRCAVLHTTSIDIDFTNTKKITDIANQRITKFTFTLSEPNEFLMGGILSICWDNGDKTIDINIQGLIRRVLELVEQYYEDNSELFKHKGFLVNDFTNK